MWREQERTDTILYKYDVNCKKQRSEIDALLKVRDQDLRVYQLHTFNLYDLQKCHFKFDLARNST